MHRRTLLRSGAAGVLGGIAGCGAVVPSPPVPEAGTRWQAPLGDVRGLVARDGLLYPALTAPFHTVGVDPADGRVSWRFERGRLAEVHGGRLFVQGAETEHGAGRRVRVLDLDGTVAWAADGRLLDSTDRTAYLFRAAERGAGHLLALDPATGERRWSVASGAVDHPLANTVVGEGLYAAVPGSPARAYRFDPETGDRRWRRDLSPGAIPQVARDGDTLYVGLERVGPDGPNPSVTALAIDGTVRWQRRWDAYFAFPRWAGSGTVVVRTTDPDAIHALDADAGTGRWRVDAEFLGVHDGLVYCRRGDHVVAADPAGGQWQRRFDVGQYPAPGEDGRRFWFVDDALLVASGPRLHALDAADGTERWRFRADGDVTFAEAVDGGVYAGTRETLYALDPA